MYATLHAFYYIPLHKQGRLTTYMYYIISLVPFTMPMLDRPTATQEQWIKQRAEICVVRRVTELLPC